MRPPEMSASHRELRSSYQYDDDDCSECSLSDGGGSISEDSMDRARPPSRGRGRDSGQEAVRRPDSDRGEDDGHDRASRDDDGRWKPTRRRSALSRRFSLDGTTIYASSHMATLDRLLRSDSGLRLKTNGTCSFLFEGRRFSVETSPDTPGEYLLYSSLGTLREVQARNRRNVLKLMAMWNEDLQARALADMSHSVGSADGGGEPRSEPAMLRIDSSKGDGNNPHVAFIYYGSLDSVEDADHFREILDDFVDDTLEFGDKLDGGLEGSRHSEDSGSRSSRLDPPESDERLRDSKSRDGNSASTPSLDPLEELSDQGSKERAPDRQPDVKPDHPPKDGTSAPSSPVHKKGSVFSKIVRGLKGRKDDIGSKAFIDPSNSQCAFVVDRSTVRNEGGVSVRLNLSKSAASFNDSHGGHGFNDSHGGGGRGFGNSVRGKSFNRSEPIIHAGGNRRGSSFHNNGGGGGHGGSFHGSRRSSNHDDHHGHRSGSRHASFHNDDRHSDAVPPRSKARSFHHPPSSSRRGSEMSESSRNSRSFHHGGPPPSRSGSRRPTSDHDASFNRSIDILDDRGEGRRNGSGSARFHGSERGGAMAGGGQRSSRRLNESAGSLHGSNLDGRRGWNGSRNGF